MNDRRPVPQLLWYLANLLPAVLDLSVGAAIAALIAAAFREEASLWWLMLGAAFAVLPDFDLLLSIAKKRNFDGDHHQTLFHRPLPMVALTAGALLLFGQPHAALLSALSIGWHYMHDTKPFGGGGINLLWPFCADRRDPDPVYPLIHWLEKYWFRPSLLSIREIAIGSILAASSLLLAGHPWWLAVIAVIAISSLATIVWIWAAFLGAVRFLSGKDRLS